MHSYKFNNKPNGLRSWAEDAAFPYRHHEAPAAAIVLIDPDFVFLRQFSLPTGVVVSAGQPAAANYRLGGQWLDFNLTAICGADCSNLCTGNHCTRITQSDVKMHYSAGPPYVLHSTDVPRMSRRWSQLVPPTYNQYPLLYAEMFAYSMAAVDLALPHTLVDGLMTGCMVPWPSGYKGLSKSADAYTKTLASNKVAKSLRTVHGAASCFLQPLVPPPFLHYCNRYAFKVRSEWLVLAKRAVEREILHNCSVPPLDPWKTGQVESVVGGNENWNALSSCAVSRAVKYARERRCGRAYHGTDVDV